MDIKELFGEAQLTYEDFQKLAEEKGAKITDLSEGKYVDKEKYSTDVKKHQDLAVKYKTDYETLSGSIEGDEGYKTKLSQLQADLEGYKEKYEEADNKLQLHTRMSLVSESGVAKEYQKFVAKEVAELVSDTVPFEDALKGYIEKNKQFLSGTKIQKKSGHSFAGEEVNEDDILSAFRKGAGLKTKGE